MQFDVANTNNHWVNTLQCEGGLGYFHKCFRVKQTRSRKTV